MPDSDTSSNSIMKNAITTLNTRRNLLKGLMAGAAGAGGLAAAGANVFASAPEPLRRNCITPIRDIFSVARTAERLAVTFYSHAISNAATLGLASDDLEYLRAAVIEEQIHEYFLRDNGGVALTSTFSFPHGANTFTQFAAFESTLQQLESIFESAYLAAVKEFAYQGRPDLSQIAAQIACIEAEHRALGRSINSAAQPANNQAFTPVLIAKVGDGPAALKHAGYLTPVSGNSYHYHQVSIVDQHIIERHPHAISCTI